MNIRHLHRPWLHALLMLAALMQLCAPLLHAQAMAAQPATLAEAAFCGNGLRGAQLELRKQLPAEVRAALARSLPEAASAPACDDCVCASPVGLAAAVERYTPEGLAPLPNPARTPWRAASAGSRLLPPSTGPPGVVITSASRDGMNAALFPDL